MEKGEEDENREQILKQKEEEEEKISKEKVVNQLNLIFYSLIILFNNAF